VSWDSLGLDPGAECLVRGVWAGEDAGVFEVGYETRVDSHDVALLVVADRARV
jgi:hypothetical protein